MFIPIPELKVFWKRAYFHENQTLTFWPKIWDVGKQAISANQRLKPYFVSKIVNFGKLPNFAIKDRFVTLLCDQNFVLQKADYFREKVKVISFHILTFCARIGISENSLFSRESKGDSLTFEPKFEVLKNSPFSRRNKDYNLTFLPNFGILAKSLSSRERKGCNLTLR